MGASASAASVLASRFAIAPVATACRGVRAIGRGGRGGRADGSGLGGGGIGRPSIGASAGRLPAATRDLRTISPDGSSGRPSGWIWRRIGELTAASRMANQRSTGVLALIAAPALLARRPTRAAGNRAVGSGGWAEKRSAWRTRPSSRAWVICSSQLERSFFTRRSSSSRSFRSRSLDASSRGAAATTVVRRSRREI